MSINITAEGLVVGSSQKFPIIRDGKKKQQKKTNQLDSKGRNIWVDDDTKPEIYEIVYNDGWKNIPVKISLAEAQKIGLDINKTNQLIGKMYSRDHVVSLG